MKFIFFALIFAALFYSFTSNFGSAHFNKMSPSDTTHVIGEHYGAGIIFYVSNDGKHGLIVASPDQRKNIPWSNGQNKLTGTTGTEQKQNYSGMGNTIRIVNLLSGDNPTGVFAAKVCLDYSVIVGGITYDDWYLPTKQELDILYQNNQKVGDFDERYYWSSNEEDAENAWIQSFYDGKQLNVDKSHEIYTLPVRAF